MAQLEQEIMELQNLQSDLTRIDALESEKDAKLKVLSGLKKEYYQRGLPAKPELDLSKATKMKKEAKYMRLRIGYTAIPVIVGIVAVIIMVLVALYMDSAGALESEYSDYLFSAAGEYESESEYISILFGTSLIAGILLIIFMTRDERVLIWGVVLSVMFIYLNWLSIISSYILLAAMLFKLCYHYIITPLRGKKLEKKAQLCEDEIRKRYAEEFTEYEKVYERIRAENMSKHYPDISKLESECENINIALLNLERKVESATILAAKDKNLESVGFVLDMMSSKRADSIKEALNLLDAKKEENSRQWLQLEIDRLDQQIWREQAAKQELARMEHNWKVEQEQRQQTKELEQIRKRLEGK